MKYGFVCVVTGAQQPVGQAIIRELAGTIQWPALPVRLVLLPHKPITESHCVTTC